MILNSLISVLILDFGFGIDVSFSPAKTPCGSYSYAAPELFNRSSEHYDAKQADVWSMGVILYAMVCGRLVFGDDSTVKRTQNRVVHFPVGISLTEALKDLILSMLRPDVRYRLTSSEILKQVWITSGIAVKPAPPLKFSVKYTKDNLGIQYRTDPIVAPCEISAPRAPVHQHQRPFFSKLGSRIASACKTRRNPE